MNPGDVVLLLALVTTIVFGALAMIEAFFTGTIDVSERRVRTLIAIGIMAAVLWVVGVALKLHIAPTYAVLP